MARPIPFEVAANGMAAVLDQETLLGAERSLAVARRNAGAIDHTISVIAITILPRAIDPVDAFKLLKVILEAGYARVTFDNPRDPNDVTFNHDICVSYLELEWDEAGRITSVSLGELSRVPWDLPPSIRTLEKLDSLHLYKCKSLPLDMGSLGELNLIDCDPSITLPNNLQGLESLEIARIEQWSAADLLSVLSCLEKAIGSLRILHFCRLSKNQVTAVFQFLIESTPFKGIRHLSFRDCGLNNDDLHYLLFQIAPKYETYGLNGLDVQNNNITSLQRIAATMECTQRVSICCLLDLGGNPVFEMIVEGDTETQKMDSRGKEEMEALATILMAWKNIADIAIDMYRKNLPPKIRFLLGFNQSKAKWLMGERKGKVFPPPPHPSSSRHWSLYLRKCAQSCPYDVDPSTMIYRVLRHGPYIQTIAGGERQSPKRLDSEKRPTRKRKWDDESWGSTKRYKVNPTEIDCREVEEILWRWDPLCVQEQPCACQMGFPCYGSHTRNIVNMVAKGCTIKQLFDYLECIRADCFMKDKDAARDASFAAAIIGVLRNEPVDL